MLTGPHIKKLNFDRCDHKVLGTCSTQAEGCCGVVACNLCIEITSDYTDEVVDRKVAPFSSPGYAATLGVVVFEAYWRRDYVTGECVFIVEVTDAVETQVLEFSKCYDAASCMAPAGSVAIQYDSKPHVLSWEPLDIVTLKHRVEGTCKKPFCGLCTCAPREICVTLVTGDCTVSELVGLEPSECKEEEPPVWEFTLVCPDGGATVSGTVSLLREEYTNACILNVVIPEHYIDVDYEWTECPVIDDIVVAFTIDDIDASVTIRSADCEMCPDDSRQCCDCRSFSDTEIRGDRSVLGDDCALDSVANSGISAASPGVDLIDYSDKRWNEGDCRMAWPIRWIEAPSPTCDDVYGGGYAVFVQRNTTPPHPAVDADIVDLCEFYLVLYHDGPDGLKPGAVNYE